jgi:hypothetical protein
MKVNPAATLAIGLCYMANALINRPEAGSDFEVLADTLSVHEIQRGVLVAVRPLVAFFMHSLLHDQGCPRISAVRVLELTQISRLCGFAGDTIGSEVTALIQRSRTRPREEPPLPIWGQEPNDGGRPAAAGECASNADGVGSMSRSKRNKLVMDEDEDGDAFGPDDVVPEPAAAPAFLEESEDPEEGPVSYTNRRVLNDIFQRMAGEMLLKVPSESQTKLSWRTGSDNQCHSLRYKDLCDSRTIPNFLRGFRQTTDAAIWDRSVKKIFPTPAELRTIKYKPGTEQPKPRFLQGLAQCHFFQEWSALIENRDKNLTNKQLQDLVTLARRKLNEKAQWLPVGKPDRLWADVGAKNGKVHGTQINGRDPPVVVLNPRFPRVADIPGGY